MKLPKELTTVTPLSKGLAMIIFIVLPFLGFYLGMQYQQSIFPPTVNKLNSIVLDKPDQQMPRERIITYTIEQGETIASVAAKWNISIDTIKWANKLTSDTLKVGQSLAILPVTGIMHKVRQGDTIESLAARYHTDKQKIIDYPFNNFSNPQTFTLTLGAILIIPDGIQEK